MVLTPNLIRTMGVLVDIATSGFEKNTCVRDGRLVFPYYACDWWIYDPGNIAQVIRIESRGKKRAVHWRTAPW
jgi:hypothetical protein